METPVLNKKQLKKALKKTKKETVKNVLSTPFTPYWPIVKGEDSLILCETLKNNLPRIKVDRKKVPWNILCKVAKEKRKEFRQNFDPVDPKVPKESSYMVFGINEVTKGLETKTLNSVLVHSEVTSNLLIKHVVDMAAVASVPVLLLPNLKVLLKENTGISSVAVGIQKTVPENSGLRVVAEKVKEINKNYPVPENYINYYRIQIENSDDDEMNNKNIQTFDTCHISQTKQEQMNISNDGSVSLEQTEDELMAIDNNDAIGQQKTNEASNVYLFRQNKKQRMFVPDKSEPTKNLMDNLNKTSLDFLSLDVAGKNTNIVKKQYKSLIVKRLKGNKDRDKRKRETMKKRKNKH